MQNIVKLYAEKKHPRGTEAKQLRNRLKFALLNECWVEGALITLAISTNIKT